MRITDIREQSIKVSRYAEAKLLNQHAGMRKDKDILVSDPVH